MLSQNGPFQRAMKLAVVSGLRCAMGPALVAAGQDRPERQTLALAALAEMVVDKLPGVPSRARLPLLLPRAIAGYWSAKKSLEHDGIDDPGAAAMGAAVAAGVATIAPLLRGTLRRVLGVPDPVIGLAEDYLALRLGGEAVGLSMDDLKQIATDSFEDVKERVQPLVDDVRERMLPV